MSLATPPKLRKLQRALYVKAKQEPDCRFHALHDKVYREDILTHAYRVCRSNGGAPGVDGQTFEEIEEQGVERWLAELREELHAGRYKPRPVRRVMLPKPGGGERPLGIPTIRDRVVQTAAKLVLEPIFEADFDDAAYGYRPRRSAQQAVQRVHRALIEGRTQVVDADLSSYFDSIPHVELVRCLARRISDRRMLRLLRQWLKAPVKIRDARGRKRLEGGRRATRGTPQGGVISPLLANVYMHRYIRAFRRQGLEERYGAVLVTYADDLVVLCRRNADEVLEATRRWMTGIGLALNERKTCLRDAWRETFDFLGYTFGPLVWPRTGKRYLGARPSKKSLTRLKEHVRGVLHRGNQAPWEEVVVTLNRKLRGWGTYFSYGSLSKARRHVDRIVYDRVRHFLRRRSNLPGRGTRRYSEQCVFGELGVLSLQRLPRRSPAHA